MARRKKAQIGQVDYKTLYDWSGGMNDFIDPALLNDNESARLENASLDEKGTLFPAKGSRKRYSEDFSVKPTNGLGAFYKSDGTSRLLIGADNELYTDAPHLIYTYDSQPDFESGTKQNVEVILAGSIKPKELPLALFSRNSIAYKSDGTHVAANQPRLEDFNLIPEASRTFSTGWTAYQGAVVTVTQNQVVPEWNTDKAVRIQTSGGTNVLKYYTTIVAPSVNGQYYHMFVRIKNIGAKTVRIHANFVDKYQDVAPGETKDVFIQDILGNGTAYLQMAFRALDPNDSLDFIAYMPGAWKKEEYIPPEFGQVVMVEEGTTNLLLYSEDFTQSVWIKTRVNISSAGTYLNYPVTRFTPNTPGQPSEVSQTFLSSGAANRTFTWSFWARGQTNRQFRVNFYGGASGTFVSYTINLTTEWQKFVITHTFPSNATSARIQWGNVTPYWGVDYTDWIEVAGVQVEEKPYATSYIKTTSTTSTRSPETLTIPTVGVLNPQEGTVECWVYINDIVWATKPLRIWSIPTPTGLASDALAIYHGTANEWGFIVDNKTYSDFGSLIPSIGWVHFAFTWKMGEYVKVYINGVLAREITGVNIPNFGSVMAIGSRADNTRHCNTLIDDLRISNRARTDEEIAAAYASGQPLPVDEWTTYKLNFDGNLLPDSKDLSSILGITSLDAADYNGTYWLISGNNGKIVKYDGTTATDLTSDFGLSGTKIRAIKWNGSYWLVAGDSGKIKKYDGTTVTDLTSTLDFGTSAIYSIEWNGSYWLIGGAGGKIKKYDGITVTDLTSTFNFGTDSIKAVKWGSTYFLVGGGAGKVKKYDGITVTDLTSTLRMGGDINTIGWNGSYFLIGANSGKIKKYDGSTATDLSSTFAFSGNVYSIAWDGKNWYVAAAGALKRYDGSAVTDMSAIVNAFPYTTPLVFYGDGVFIFGGKPLQFSLVSDEYTYVWYSPVLDVTNATDKNSGHIAIEADIPGASAIVAKSRSSPDGVTWSDWYNALSDGTLQHPADNYIQVALQMKPGKGQLPTINKATISFDGQAQATLLASDFTPGGQFFMDMLLDYMVIVNGIDAPRKYDGKELTLLGGSPPHGSYVVAHKNRLWMARGSRLYFSDLLNLESWPVLNFIDISPNDGDVITGLKTYGDYLVITKGHSMWLLTGEGPNTFAVKRIHTDRGAYAPRSLTVVEGYICFVSDDGIYFSDLSKAVLISERIRKYWNTLNLRRINQAVAFYVDHKLYVAVPEGNSMTNNAVIVYDMLRQAFVGIRRNWNVSCYTSFREGGRLIHLFGDSQKGQVYKMNEGYSDDGKPIPFLWKSKELDFNVPDAYKRWNKIYVQVRPSQYDAELIFTFFVDGKQIGSTSVAVPAATNGEIYTVLVLASKAGVVGGKRLAIQVAQNVLDNPVGIHRVSVEYIIHSIQPSFYA